MLDIEDRPARPAAALPSAECPMKPFDLVTVPAREGLEAVDILRLRGGVGAVLHDREGDTLGFLVPPGTARRWQLTGSSCVPTSEDRAPGAADSPGLPVTGSGWLVAPRRVAGHTTPPEQLRAALCEAVRVLTILDRSCR